MNGRHRPSGSDWIRRSTRLALYTRDGWRCVVCDLPPQPGRTEGLSLHHVDPKGGNKPDNLVTACMGCNVRMGETRMTTDDQLRADLARSITLTPEMRAQGRVLAKVKWPNRYRKEKNRERSRRHT